VRQNDSKRSSKPNHPIPLSYVHRMAHNNVVEPKSPSSDGLGELPKPGAQQLSAKVIGCAAAFLCSARATTGYFLSHLSTPEQIRFFPLSETLPPNSMETGPALSPRTQADAHGFFLQHQRLQLSTNPVDKTVHNPRCGATEQHLSQFVQNLPTNRNCLNIRILLTPF